MSTPSCSSKTYSGVIQKSFESRFGCIVCYNPRLRMVYGACQHRLCEDCLYTKDGLRKKSFDCCPYCQLKDAFPLIRPIIPEDNIAIQKYLGVSQCPNKGCNAELWSWEITGHLQNCQGQALLPKGSAGALKSCERCEVSIARLVSFKHSKNMKTSRGAGKVRTQPERRKSKRLP